MSSDPQMPLDPEAMPDPEFEAPDLVGAVEGWRAWKCGIELPPYGAAPKLYSANHSYYWKPRRVSMADCPKCGERVPGESCTCGFYSAKSLDHLLTMGYQSYDMESGNVSVVGQVANWGKVIEASQGWRAQYAYPVRLWVPFESAKLAKPLKEAYGVPVGLKNWLKPARGVM